MERLQKVMAEAGIGSRRHCEDIIREGLVKVNGTVVLKLPVLVDPKQDRIVVDGRRLKFEPKVYYLLNKPKKVVCTNSDPQGRTRAIDLLKGVKERVYPVGRLDADSKGLVIMTNDGELANHLTHPKYGVAKTYIAEVAGSVSGADIEKLQKGMYLPQGKASVSRVKILRRGPKQSLLEITLQEGRNRQIKVMLRRLGHTVKQLTRVKIGKLILKGLGVGKYRVLTAVEVKALQRLSKQASTPRKRTKKRTLQDSK